jgi:hypothetical protein
VGDVGLGLGISSSRAGIIAAGLVAFAPSLSHAENPCALRQLAHLPVTFNEQTGLPSVTIKIGGQDVSMVLSTESIASALRPDAVERLDGKPEWKEELGIQLQMGGKDIMRYATLNGISLGRALLSDFTFVLVPRDITLHEDGQLGMDILANFDLEIDLMHNTLNLFEHYNCAPSPVYWSNSYGQADMLPNGLHYITFTAQVNGIDTRTTLATEFPLSSMPRRMAAEQFGIRKEDDRSASCSGDRQQSDRFVSLTIDGLSINNPEINTNCDYPSYIRAKTIEPVLAIGRNHLKKLRLYVAWQQRKIYFTATTATK